MSTLLRKAIRDLHRAPARSTFVALAIAVGITGFGAVLSSYAILTRELDRGHLATNPASATLWLDRVDDELLRSLGPEQEIAAAEARRTIAGRVRAGPFDWRELRLFVVQDFADVRVSRVVPQQGAWPPARDEILIERDALGVAGVRIGDDVTIRTSRGRERTLRVAGTVHDVGQAQARMEQMVYGYVTLDVLPDLDEEPFLDQLKVLVTGDALDEAHVLRVATSLVGWLEARGQTVRRLEVPEPGKHPHSDLMGTLLLVLSSFGLFALLLSGALVVNLLTALLASQVRQIGVMKALGASPSQVARVYFAQALLLGLAALAVSVPAGMVAARVLCLALARFLNFDVASFATPAWVWALELAAGIAVPLLAAAWPVWRGSRIPVRVALADVGVATTRFGIGALDRALAGVRGGSRPVLLSVRNAFRRRARFVITMATLALGGLFFTAALDVRASMIHTLDRSFAAIRHELIVTLSSMESVETMLRAARATPGVRDAEGWITTSGQLPERDEATSDDAAAASAPAPAISHGHAGLRALHGGGGPAHAGDRFSVTAIPGGTRLLAPELVAGRALQEGDVEAIVINTRLAAKLPVCAPGDVLEFGLGPALVRFPIAGVVRESFSGAAAYVPLAFFERAGHTGVANSLRLALDDATPDGMRAVKAALERNLEQEGIRAASSSSQAERRRSFDEHMVMIYVALIVMAAVIVSVGALGLATTMSVNVLERRRELGILRALGAGPGMVATVLVIEAAVVALASFTLATIVSVPVSRAIGSSLEKALFRGGLDFTIEPLGHAGWLVVSLVVAALASVLPALHAARQPLRESLAQE